jgi:hypothetical protein
MLKYFLPETIQSAGNIVADDIYKYRKFILNAEHSFNIGSILKLLKKYPDLAEMIREGESRTLPEKL